MNSKDEGSSCVDVKAHERMIKARFYRWVMDAYGGLWEKASKDVEKATGVHIPHETLRQNVEPVSQKSGIPPRRIKDTRRLEALKDFLIAKKYLREAELREPEGYEFAASALSAFLNREETRLVSQHLQTFRGRFVGERAVSRALETIDLHIHYAGPERPTKVSEVSSLEDGGDGRFNDKMESKGWIACNGHGFYIIFLRDALTAKCYLVLQGSPPISMERPIQDVALLCYDTAWAGELNKEVANIHDVSEKVVFRLPRSTDEMCFFLTRV